MPKILVPSGSKDLDKLVFNIAKLAREYEVLYFRSLEEISKKLKSPHDIILFALGVPTINPQGLLKSIPSESIVDIVALYTSEQKEELEPLIDFGLNYSLGLPTTSSKLLSTMNAAIAVRKLPEALRPEVIAAYRSFNDRNFKVCSHALLKNKKILEHGSYFPRYLLGACYYYLKDKNKAKELLDQAVEEEPRCFEGFGILKQISLVEKNRQRWLYYWDKEVQGNLTNLRGAFDLAKEFLRNDNPESAIKLLSKMADCMPGQDEVAFFLCTLLISSGQFEKAIDRLEKICKDSKEPSRFYLLLTDCFLNQGDLTNASNALDQAQKGEVSDYDIEVRLGELAILEQKYLAAESNLNKALIAKTNDPRAKRGTLVCLYHKEKYTEAKKGFSQIWNDFENDDISAFYLAKLTEKLEDKISYFDYIQKAEKLSPSNKVYIRELAIQKIKNESLAKAREYLEKVVKEQRDDYELSLMASMVCQNLEDYEMAYDLAQKADSLVVDDWKTQFLVPALYLQNNLLKPLTKKLFINLNKSLKIYDKWAPTYYFLAVAHYIAKDTEKAVPLLENGLKLSPDWDKLLELKRKVDAGEVLQEADLLQSLNLDLLWM